MERSFTLRDDRQALLLFGNQDEHLKLIESEFGVSTVARGHLLILKGEDEPVERAARFVEDLLEILDHDGDLRREQVVNGLRLVTQDSQADWAKLSLDRIEVSSKKRFISPRTPRQREYVEAIRNQHITFGIGPAGTGKTYLAMAMAVAALKKQQVERIILTRPAVEAGERLGYLPGDLAEKISPYLRPLYDALFDMMDTDLVHRNIEKGVIEVAPLAFMRGRTLNDSFVILDEAQNSTPEQMKMFLTRLGFESKAVVTGDLTQSDLPNHQDSGLEQVRSFLDHIPGIEFTYFTGRDVVRHELVQRIIEAYEKFEAGAQGA
ncbi:MAG: PhoH family protein [Candidatus Omnitrophica bacterium]|nr:PhoH family protein [Candidatus Omnitrophota bacterium]